MKIAVLDTTHAGCVIAEEYAANGHDVTAIDIYHTSRERHSTRETPMSYTLTEHTPTVEFDLAVIPVHTPRRHFRELRAKRYITHHEAVGELLRERKVKTTMIEITGTRSKTTTALTLAHILESRYSVAVNTSAGLFINEKKIADLSIAPGNVLRAIELTEEESPDIYIFEISLGGTGEASYGVLTTLDDDYLIAEETKRASDAKIKTLFGEDTHPVVKSSTLDRVRRRTKPGRPITTFGSERDSVYIEGERLHYKLQEETVKERGEMSLPPLFEPEAYRTGIEAAVATALHLIKPEEIEERLRGYRGAIGRMQLREVEGRTLIDNSNSGARAEELNTLLTKAERYGRVFLIHGEDGRVCEGLNEEESKRTIREWEDKLIGVALIGLKLNGTETAENIDDALRIALQQTKPGDVILSHIKCFR